MQRSYLKSGKGPGKIWHPRNNNQQMSLEWDSWRQEQPLKKKGGKDVICHGYGKKGHYLSECYNTPDEDKERILKIKTQEWNEKKKERSGSG